MKGGNVDKFIDQSTYEECAVIYKGVKYFFHGLIYDKEKNTYSYVIDIGTIMGTMKKLYLTKHHLL